MVMVIQKREESYKILSYTPLHLCAKYVDSKVQDRRQRHQACSSNSEIDKHTHTQCRTQKSKLRPIRTVNNLIRKQNCKLLRLKRNFSTTNWKTFTYMNSRSRSFCSVYKDIFKIQISRQSVWVSGHYRKTNRQIVTQKKDQTLYMVNNKSVVIRYGWKLMLSLII